MLTNFVNMCPFKINLTHGEALLGLMSKSPFLISLVFGERGVSSRKVVISQGTLPPTTTSNTSAISTKIHMNFFL